jgi:Uma2 family endonuclease
MTYAPSQLLTFEEFLAQYQDEPAFELADGELIEMEPTGPHEAVAGKVASQLNLAIAAMGVSWIIPRTCILRPLADQATARRPDVAVLDEQALVARAAVGTRTGHYAGYVDQAGGGGGQHQLGNRLCPQSRGICVDGHS